jgi:hypothetical protein
LKDKVPNFGEEIMAYLVEFLCLLHYEGLLYILVLLLPKPKETIKKSKEIAYRDLNI